jgi:hypothetical protein
VNGGRNYNNRCSFVNKIWLYAGKSEYLGVLYKSNNLTSADNQQERFPKMKKIIFPKTSPQIGYYLAGFTDGEGNFYVSFRPRDDYQML